MTNDDRIRRAFDDLRSQVGGVVPAGIGSRMQPVPGPSRRLLPALSTAALTVLVIGLVVVLRGGPDPDTPVAGTTDGTGVDTTLSQPAVTSVTVPGCATLDPDSGVEETVPCEVSTDTTILPEDGNATVPDEGDTAEPTIVLPLDGGSGWRVVDVASDDVLNVRANGGVEYPIVGTLAPDDVDVVLTGWGATQLDGTGWWGVRLANGIEGFVNRRFLAPPASWHHGLDDRQCNPIAVEGVDDQAAGLQAVPVSDATGIQGFIDVQIGQCRRFVVVLGSGEAFAPPSDAGTVPEGVAVYSFEGEVVLDFTGARSVRNVDTAATNDLLGSALVLTSVPGGSNTSLAPRVHIFTGGGRATVGGVEFLSDPARVVVDIVGGDTGSSGVMYAAGGPTVLVGLVADDGGAIEVRGFARWFEAQGVAQLTDDSGVPHVATWTGDSVNGDPFGSETGVYAPWSPTWGEFVFDVEKIPPGNYQLFVGEFCLVDEANDVWAECGVTVDFTAR